MKLISKFAIQREVFFRNLKLFLRSPRRISAIVPALTIYAVWSIGIAYSNLLGISPEVASSPLLRHFFSLVSVIYAYIFINVWSRIILNRKNLLFWPIEYLGTLAIGVLPILVYWIAVYDLHISMLILIYFRLIMLLAVTESIVAFLIFQIQLRSSELEQHQISLVTYEEKFRTSIFNHLHDKVQSRLFSVGIQLNQIKSDLDSETAEKVEEIVAQLEQIRILDVRKSSIEIVPPISPVGLFPSILSLLKSHKPVLDGKFLSQLKTPLSDSEEDHFGIGIYRIIEQALINSLIHGKATELEVIISEDKSNLSLEITNNGKLLDTAQISQGHGFAVIDGWVSKLKGYWTISNRKEQVCLQVRFER